MKIWYGTAYNRAYLASCLWHFTQIQQSWTSDTLGTLGEILLWTFDGKVKQEWVIGKRKE